MSMISLMAIISLMSLIVSVKNVTISLYWLIIDDISDIITISDIIEIYYL